jgi:hypothetical protein
LLTGQASVADLPGMHDLAQRLDNHGIFVVGDLLARPAARDEALARDLGLSKESMRKLRRHAEFAAACPQPHSAAGWVKMLHVVDVNDVEALRRKTADVATLRQLQQTLAALAIAGHVSAPTEEQLTKWAAGKPEPTPVTARPADAKDVKDVKDVKE